MCKKYEDCKTEGLANCTSYKHIAWFVNEIAEEYRYVLEATYDVESHTQGKEVARKLVYNLFVDVILASKSAVFNQLFTTVEDDTLKKRVQAKPRIVQTIAQRTQSTDEVLGMLLAEDYASVNNLLISYYVEDCLEGIIL